VEEIWCLRCAFANEVSHLNGIATPRGCQVTVFYSQAVVLAKDLARCPIKENHLRGLGHGNDSPMDAVHGNQGQLAMYLRKLKLKAYQDDFFNAGFKKRRNHGSASGR
jgi:hypothetical protein